jgi:hypothetical protein
MKCNYACQSPEHAIARRTFLGGLVGFGSAMGLAGIASPLAASQLAAQQKHMLVIFLSGGVSQLETWDPKPKTDTGGPFRAISTSVPGIQISELLPHTAKQMHHMALVRSINTKENDHGKGRVCMETGRREMPGFNYPHLGAVASKLLTHESNPLPGFIRVGGGNSVNKKDAAYLGPQFGSVTLGDGKPPANSLRPDIISAEADAARNEFRRRASDRFSLRRRAAETEAYVQSFDQAQRLMERRDVFDMSHESPAIQEKYGSHEFGRHCLLARRLIEHGVSFVQVSHSNYDTHHENFNFHIEQLGEFDATFAFLLQDLHDRGLLEKTLVVVMSEFGRTPKINERYGRDHWGTAWSIAMAGCGIQHGAVIGKTNDNGTQVIDREVNHGHLFHTYLRAVGVDPTDSFTLNGRPMPVADPAASAIKELLV